MDIVEESMTIYEIKTRLKTLEFKVKGLEDYVLMLKGIIEERIIEDLRNNNIDKQWREVIKKES